MAVTLIGQIEGELLSEGVPVQGMLSSVRLVSSVASRREGPVDSGRKIVPLTVIYMVVVEVIVTTSVFCLLSRSMMTKGFSLQGPTVGMISTNSLVAVNAQVY